MSDAVKPCPCPIPLKALEALYPVSTSPDKATAKTFEILGSRHGRGHIHITDLGVRIESQRYGKIVSIGMEQIARYSAAKNKFRIDWTEGGKKLYYEVAVNSGKELLAAYQKANAEFANSPSETGRIAKNPDYITRSGIRDKIARYVEQEASKAKDRRVYVEGLVPKGAEKWNDCWLDKQNGLYITYNRFFTTDHAWHATRTHLKWASVYGNDAVVLPCVSWTGETMVRQFHGCPAWRMGSTQNPVWYIIPTITDEMLTKEMVRDRLHLDKSRPRIDYNTESPRYYVGNEYVFDRSIREGQLEAQMRGSSHALPDDELLLRSIEDYYQKQRELGLEVLTQRHYK